MKPWLSRTAWTIAVLSYSFLSAHAAPITWQPGGGGSWATPGNWNPASTPNSAADSAVFNSPTAARTVTVDSGAPGFTVNGISFDVTANFSNTLSAGTAGSNLILDNGGAGTSLSTSGGGTGNTTISAPIVLNDTLTANVTQTTSTSAAGSLNLTGAISGPGAFIKNGAGTATFGTAAKTYSGATQINNGRMRISAAAAPSSSSSMTIGAGGQIVFAGAVGSKTLSASMVNLNGTGLSTFPGALRIDLGAETITNPIVLQSDASINVINNTSSLALPGGISGIGRLELGTLPGNPLAQGSLLLSTANSYQGGTLVTQGTLVLSGAAATLGSGNVYVDGLSLGPGSSVAAGILSISSGVLDAIANSAVLTLTGDDGSDGAIGGKALLGAGVNEVVGGLVLGGVTQLAPGTYGSSASGAMFQFDQYFSGAGAVTLVPEPATFWLFAAALGLLAGYRRWIK